VSAISAFLKNSLVQINSKLSGKNHMITYAKLVDDHLQVAGKEKSE